MMYDKNHWLNLQPPSAPFDSDVEVYKELLEPGRVLLLGCTKKLLPLADRALDIEPLYDDAKIVRGDWRANEEFFDNIIGDGVFHLSQELCDDILKMCAKHSRTFICRAFNERLETMRYACYFPQAEDFSIRPEEIIRRPLYTFYKWRF